MDWFVVAVMLFIALGLIVLLVGMRYERRQSTRPSRLAPEPSAVHGSAVGVDDRVQLSTADVKPTFVLPFLAVVVLVGGVVLSAVLAFMWPLQRVEDEISLLALGTDIDAPEAMFNWPLFILGAGPSIVTAAVLYAAGAIVEELRLARLERILTSMG
jgi:hypothetical protein